MNSVQNIITDMPLREERRQQLDQIVRQMADNGEIDSDIQFVVDDFKKKYESESSAPTKSSLLGNLQGELSKRGGQFGRIFEQTARGEITPAETGLRTVGTVAGAAGDIAGTALRGAFRALPEFVEQPLRELGRNILQTRIGKSGIDAARRGIETYNQWKQENPRAAENLESAVNIASIFPVSRGARMAAREVGEAARFGIRATEPAVESAGRGLIHAGEKIQQTVIRPTQLDIKHGFKIENVTKYDVGGSLDDAFERTENLLKQKNEELKQLIVQHGDHHLDSTLGKFVDELKQEAREKKLRGLGTTAERNRTIREIETELSEIDPQWQNRPLTFSDAIDAKRAAGIQGAFLHDPLKKVVSPAEDVWNHLYGKLKEATERIAPERFAETNKTISELIPIEQALIRRIPIAQRNNVLSLPDIISLVGGTAVSPGALSVGIIHRLLKSGRVARGLTRFGQRLQR